MDGGRPAGSRHPYPRIEEVMGDQQARFLAPPGDEVGLAAAILSLRDDRLLRLGLGEANRDLVARQRLQPSVATLAADALVDGLGGRGASSHWSRTEVHSPRPSPRSEDHSPRRWLASAG